MREKKVKSTKRDAGEGKKTKLINEKKETVRGTEEGEKKNLSPAHTVQKKFLAFRKTLTLEPSEGAAGEINSKGIEKEDRRVSKRRRNLSVQAAQPQRAVWSRQEAGKTNTGARRGCGEGRGGAAQRWVYPQISVVTRLRSRKLGQGF